MIIYWAEVILICDPDLHSEFCVLQLVELDLGVREQSNVEKLKCEGTRAKKVRVNWCICTRFLNNRLGTSHV
jgi:hypothetical protein